MQHSEKDPDTTSHKRDRRALTGWPASRLALFAIIALLIGIGLSWRPSQTAKAGGVFLVEAFSITGGTPSPSDNDYTRIKDAIEAAVNGDILILSGTFDWTKPMLPRAGRSATMAWPAISMTSAS